MSAWSVGILAYAGLALFTALPVIMAVVNGVRLHPGGPTFEDSLVLSDAAKVRLTQHYHRMQGTLGFWKQQAEIYRRLHYYILCWSIPSSIIIPFLVQTIDKDPNAKWLITIISSYTAVLLAFHRALKVDANFKAFRYGESEFYDTYRRLLDRPQSFGESEVAQLDSYFDAVENIRKYIRNAEIDNMPTVEQVKTQLDSEKKNNKPA